MFEIKQFYDSNLSHASYAILSDGKIALIDPARNPKQYYEYAQQYDAKITAVIETHPHADFVSSHAEISKTTGAPIYVSKLLNPFYKFIPFDEGDEIIIGNAKLRAINTPGHSPDSISIIIEDEEGKEIAIATGDTLFVGDVGRPDLRESAGSINKSKEELARMMFHTLNEKFMRLPNSMFVYPAHGAGSLCGKSKSTDTFTTIGREKIENYALQPMSENDFVKELLKDQPFIPKYFGYNVELNRQGAPDFKESIKNVVYLNSYNDIEKEYLIIDTRPVEVFAKEHYKGAVNLRAGLRFETWLGTLVTPGEKFYLISDTKENLDLIVERTAKIGYEVYIKGALVHRSNGNLESSKQIDVKRLKERITDYTIIDVRDKSEVALGKIFKNAIAIPLNEIKERYSEIPTDKPIIVHCAGGDRSSAASGLLENLLQTKVFDLGKNINSFN